MAAATQNFVLTGCASGIGKHVADQLVARGHRLFATDINFDAMVAHAKDAGWPEDRVHLRQLDVRDAAAWKVVFDEAVATLGHVDVMMNIAGYLKPGWIHETDEEEVHRHFDVNVKGVIFGTKAATRHMVPRGTGHIVNLASMAGLTPVSGIGLYSATKFAVRAFSIAAANELRDKGVYVTAVCPDAVQTPMLDLQVDYDEAAVVFSANRFLTVEDISRVIFEKVLPNRPMEVAIPRHRGWIARLTNLMPGLAMSISPLFLSKGRKAQLRLRGHGEG